MKTEDFRTELAQFTAAVALGKASADDMLKFAGDLNMQQIEELWFFTFLAKHYPEVVLKLAEKPDATLEKLVEVARHAWLTRADAAEEMVAAEKSKVLCMFLGEYDETIIEHEAEVNATIDFLADRQELSDHQKITFFQQWVANKRIEWAADGAS